MSLVTLDDIIKTIRFRGDYQNVRKFPPADLRKEAQNAFEAFWQIVADAHNGWWDTDTTIATVAHQRYIALPADVWALQALDRLEGSDYVPMHQVPMGERNRFGMSEGTPSNYRTSARGAELSPIPDAVYTLRVSYTPKAPKLAVSQPREYYNGWEDYIIESVLLVLDRREKQSTDAREKAIDAIEKQVRGGASARRQQEPEYLNLREGGSYDPFRDGLL